MAVPNKTREGVPSFALKHAPLLHLYTKDPYRPSSAAKTLLNTRPQINLQDVPIPSSPLTLANLDQLNNVGQNGGTDIFLASFEDVSKDPGWLKGEEVSGGGEAAERKKTGVIIVVEKEGGVVDVFYFYFFAFNWGGIVLDNQLGDHVGDWEHNMIRFVNGVPKYVWFSQHANGEAYTFEALEKDGAGERPLVYCANGSHALYPTPGNHDHTIPNVNLPFRLLLVDETDKGPLYDPLPASHSYSYSPTSSTLRAYDTTSPTSFLHFRGRWGDAEYPANDPRQSSLFGNRKYVGGPTGPLDKQLDRKEVWPENSFSQGQFMRKRLGLGIVDRVKGWSKKAVRKGKGVGAVKKVLVSGEVVK